MKLYGGLHDESGIISATASPASRGCVYIEAATFAPVDRITRTVAWIRRRVPPEQLPAADCLALFQLPTKPEIEPGSWIRYTRPGRYCGDLAWVDAYDPLEMQYQIRLVPRVAPDESASKRRRHALPASRPARGILTHHIPRRAAHGHSPRYHNGLLVIPDVRACYMSDERIGPSPEELDYWMASASYIDSAAAARLDPTLHEVRYSQSVRALREILRTGPALVVDDKVKVVSGQWVDYVGAVVDVDELTHEVSIRLRDFEALHTIVTLPAAYVLVDFHVGDFVEVREGLHAGLCGWIGNVDWTDRIVIILEHVMLERTHDGTDIADVGIVAVDDQYEPSAGQRIREVRIFVSSDACIDGVPS